LSPYLFTKKINQTEITMSDADLKAIIRMDQLNQKTVFNRYAPSEALKDTVECFWTIEWDMPAGECFTQQLLPNPQMNIVHYPEGHYAYRTMLEGPVKQFFHHTLKGRGELIGVKFRIGGFNSFTSHPVRYFTDSQFDVNTILGHPAWEALSEMATLAAKRSAIESILLSYSPVRDAKAREAEQIVAYIRENEDAVNVAIVANVFDLRIRTLQRLFDQYVGVNPKWVIRVFRLQSVKAELEAYSPRALADLAQRLSYTDQAHMIRDFKAFTGLTPTQYPQRL
jgi:AraC-like DNA-binding protein